MKARIVKPCTVVCGAGSVVEITPEQYAALGDAAVACEPPKKGKSKEKERN